MRPYAVLVLLILYNTECKWFFEALNGFKLKTCQLQSFLTFLDLQLSC
jgi:hypothetical protein